MDVVLPECGSGHYCRTEIHYGKCYLVWSIENFSFCPQITGEALTSNSFTIEGRDFPEFQLKLYPRGTLENPFDLILKIILTPNIYDSNTFVDYDCYFMRDSKRFCRYQNDCILTQKENERVVKSVSRAELLSHKDKIFPDDILCLVCALKASYMENNQVCKIKAAP